MNAVGRVTSGRDCDGQQLRYPDLFGNWLTIGSQAGNVNLDRLDGTLPAFLDGAATGEAPWKRRDDDEETAILLGLYHDRLGAHLIHPVTGGSEFIGGDTAREPPSRDRRRLRGLHRLVVVGG